MGKTLRITKQTKLLLAEMMLAPTGDHYGFEVSKATGLRPSTLYPTFARLEEAGWIEGRWEIIDPVATRRPPRRYYRLTVQGISQAASALQANARSAFDASESSGVVGAG